MTMTTKNLTIARIKAKFEATLRQLADVEVVMTSTRFSVCGAKAEVTKAVDFLDRSNAWERTRLVTYEDYPDIPTFTVAVYKHA